MDRSEIRAQFRARPTFTALALALFVGCSQPESRADTPAGVAPEVASDRPVTSIDALSEETRETLAHEPEMAVQLARTLDVWFGDHFTPRYTRLSEWRAAGYDPTPPVFEGTREREGFDADELGRLRERNLAHWGFVLEAIDGDAGRLPGPWPARRDLNRAWNRLRRERATLGEEAFRHRARELFAEDYPTPAGAERLYARHCQQCHGMRGAGDGPMSNMMEPRPRDYRRGVFKFSSVSAPARPRREDLRRTLEHGLPGTQMPAWDEVLSAGEREALIDRVRWIAIRGEVERWLVASWIADEEPPAEAIEEAYRTIWERWLTADEHFVALQDPVPPATPEAIARGDALFHDAAGANCVSCHGERGRGDGPAAVEVLRGGTRRALLVDEWGLPAWPRDLTDGVFRGGSRPIDLYRRVHCGVHGTPMPANAGTLTERETWDVVHYVRSIAGLLEGSAHD